MRSRDNRLLRADGEQRIRQFVAHEENALENAHYQFNGHSPLNLLSAFVCNVNIDEHVAGL
jgi:hypothetical protein